MKKRMTSLFLILALALSLAGTALAAEEMEITVTEKDIGGGKTVTATLSEDKTYVDLTVTGLTSGEQYLVLMVSGIYETVTDVDITESMISYIDQKAENGGISFKVYPNRMDSSTILLSGKDVPLTIVATVEVPYKLGDLNGDGDILGDDAILLNQCLSGKITKEELENDPRMRMAADIDRDGSIVGPDGILMRQYLSSIISSFE